jgi:hypothetical protein
MLNCFSSPEKTLGELALALRDRSLLPSSDQTIGAFWEEVQGKTQSYPKYSLYCAFQCVSIAVAWPRINLFLFQDQEPLASLPFLVWELAAG